ncbi:MAG: cobyrinate a,c-diamide synthase [Selenomonadaceae bacterium]|nr:cobyrinate a,c-diamide synthase [Selenomonadaceae bacterium]
MKNNFPRLIIAATQSGSGKTTITAGLLAALKNRGLSVQSYKIGPDYIDTGWHELASGKISHNLDSWLVGEDKLKEIFIETASRADISIIEGVMGLYDGGKGGISSTAEISKLINAPVILVIDAKSMGTSAAAVALGFREFDKSVKLVGVILNRIGSDSHKKMIIDALNKLGIKCFGAIKRNNEFILPERHLGLVPTTENKSADIIKRICAAVEEQIDVDALIELAKNSSPLEIPNPCSQFPVPSIKIAVARDEAFSFYYKESLKVLEKLGAEIIYFSPLNDKTLPENISGLIIGGGFPEMFAAKLQENKNLRADIFNAAENGLPIFAECGGFMYLMKTLIDFDGKSFEMCGVIDGSATMTNKLQTVGYVEAEILKDCVIGKAGDKIRAHEFHFSKELETSGDRIFKCKRMRTGNEYFAGIAKKNFVASYLHIHFAGCPNAAKNFVDACKDFGGVLNGK